MSSKELIKQLNKLGWQEVRIKGSHHQFKHPNQRLSYNCTAPKERFTEKILIQAGLK